MAVDRARRLVFGEVAELYDRHRPSYPEPLIDEIAELIGGGDSDRAVLEVGAGTGKATTLLAERGIPVVAVEPSPEMAMRLEQNCARFDQVVIEQSDFEHWDPAGRTFPLVVSAQAWHWIQPRVGFPKAARILTAGGWLAAFWNRTVWAEVEFRDALLRAYADAAPELSPSDDPMHPAHPGFDTDRDWRDEVAATRGLTDDEVRHYRWAREYTIESYLALIGTHSAIRVMAAERRAQLLWAVGEALAPHGPTVALPLATRLCLARRA